MATKYLLFVLALTGYSISQAEMYWDCRTNEFFTYPRPEGIDNIDYDNYTRKFFAEFLEHIHSNGKTVDYAWRMANVNARRLASVSGSITAKRFVEDLDLLRHPDDAMKILGALNY
jgi:hypothetical protein